MYLCPLIILSEYWRACYDMYCIYRPGSSNIKRGWVNAVFYDVYHIHINRWDVITHVRLPFNWLVKPLLAFDESLQITEKHSSMYSSMA